MCGIEFYCNPYTHASQISGVDVGGWGSISFYTGFFTTCLQHIAHKCLFYQYTGMCSVWVSQTHILSHYNIQIMMCLEFVYPMLSASILCIFAPDQACPGFQSMANWYPFTARMTSNIHNYRRKKKPPNFMLFDRKFAASYHWHFSFLCADDDGKCTIFLRFYQIQSAQNKKRLAMLTAFILY